MQKYFQMNLKLPFWQLELHPDSRYITKLYANNKFFTYKHLIMGVKPTGGRAEYSIKTNLSSHPLCPPNPW